MRERAHHDTTGVEGRSADIFKRDSDRRKNESENDSCEMVVSSLDLGRVEFIIHGLNSVAELVVIEHDHVENKAGNEAIDLAEVGRVVADLVVLLVGCEV